MSLQSKQGLRKKLANKKYRDAFVASRIAQTIAFQLRVLRQEGKLSQADLAKELGTSQNAISRMENPQYGRPSISTLRKVASFFNVGLVVRFAPLSEIVDWTMKLSPQSVNVPDLEHDTGFVERKPIVSDVAAESLAYKALNGTGRMPDVEDATLPGETSPKLGQSNKVIKFSVQNVGER